MSVFTEKELHYLLGDWRLGRIATVGADGTPHIVPTGWSYNAELDAIDIVRTERAALVVDDVVPPWQPRGIEIRGAPRSSRGRLH